MRCVVVAVVGIIVASGTRRTRTTNTQRRNTCLSLSEKQRLVVVVVFAVATRGSRSSDTRDRTRTKTKSRTRHRARTRRGAMDQLGRALSGPRRDNSTRLRRELRVHQAGSSGSSSFARWASRRGSPAMTSARASLPSGRMVSHATLPGRRSLFEPAIGNWAGCCGEKAKKRVKNSAEGRAG